MRKIGTILVFVLAWLLSGCGGKESEFVIEGTLNNLGGRPLYAVYELQDRIEVDTLRPQNGFITLKNNSEQLIPIQFYYFDKTPFTKIYVQNGDRIELSGDGEDPFGLALKGGNSLNKELFKFNHANKELLQTWLTERNKATSGIRSQRYNQLCVELQGVIATYVGEHRGSPVSAILVGDYLLGEATETVCDSLIGLLDETVLMNNPGFSLERYRQERVEQAVDTLLPAFTWVTVADTMAVLDTKRASATLLYFQSSDHFNTARRYKTRLKEWVDRYDTQELQVVEVSLDSDSTVWKQKIEGDTVKWERRWAKNGYLDDGVRALHIQRLPYLVVADSLGRVVARGLPLDSVSAYIKQLVNSSQE